jgi:hypothetical protein
MILFNCNLLLFIPPEDGDIDGRNILEDTLLLKYLKLLLCICWCTLNRAEGHCWTDQKLTYEEGGKIHKEELPKRQLI